MPAGGAHAIPPWFITPVAHVLHVDAVVQCDPAQAGGVALADGAELPLPRPAVQLAEHHGGSGGGVLGEVEAGELGVVVGVDDPVVGVGDMSEALPPRSA